MLGLLLREPDCSKFLKVLGGTFKKEVKKNKRTQLAPLRGQGVIQCRPGSLGLPMRLSEMSFANGACRQKGVIQPAVASLDCTQANGATANLKKGCGRRTRRAVDIMSSDSEDLANSPPLEGVGGDTMQAGKK